MEPREFNFGDDSVASSYDRNLVPILFEPWAARLIEDHGPWDGLDVLDLATGTGIVAQQLAPAVGDTGLVVAADMNPQMLALAKERCQNGDLNVRFVECSARALPIEDASLDVVVCQQGFQFFPDKRAAAMEMRRVLREGGRAIATTWLPVADCEYFGAICTALEAIGETEISETMRAPFDFMPAQELVAAFSDAGFVDIQHELQKMPFEMDGGIAQATELAYATPIGPKLVELSDDDQARFRAEFSEVLHELCPDGTTMGRMATNVVSAVKPS